jgi:hypothetical protein
MAVAAMTTPHDGGTIELVAYDKSIGKRSNMAATSGRKPKFEVKVFE